MNEEKRMVTGPGKYLQACGKEKKYAGMLELESLEHGAEDRRFRPGNKLVWNCSGQRGKICGKNW